MLCKPLFYVNYICIYVYTYVHGREKMVGHKEVCVDWVKAFLGMILGAHVNRLNLFS